MTEREHGHGERGIDATAGVAKGLIEAARQERLPNEVIERLEIDLLMDRTATWSRINLKYTRNAFNQDMAPVATHWRMAKIMDAMVVLDKRLKVTLLKPDGRGGHVPFTLSPDGIPEAIYDTVEKKQADEKIWKVLVKPPIPPVPQDVAPEEFSASLADFAHMLDVIKMNKELEGNRIRMDELTYRFFKGGGKDPIRAKARMADGATKEIDLLDRKLNPRDDYKVLDFQDYIKVTERSRLDIKNTGSDRYRYESTGHREKSCHGWLFKYRGKLIWGMISGELAQLESMSDIQKGSKVENYKGQPQEIMNMAENAPEGPCVETEYPYLDQRTGLNAQQNASATNTRTSRQMVGLTMLEEPKTHGEKLDKESKKEDVVIDLLGGDNLNQHFIEGQFAQHNDFRKRLGLKEFDKYDASDIIFTDVFAPIIKKNAVDWLVQITSTYKVSKPQAIETLGSNNFPGFVIRIRVRDIDRTTEDGRQNPNYGKIVRKDFVSMKQLKEYVDARLFAGHIIQGPVNPERSRIDAAPPGSGDGETETRDVEIKITKENGKEFGNFIREKVLPESYEIYFYKYVDGQGTFPPIRAADGTPLKPEDKGAGQKKVLFEKIVEAELEKMSEDTLVRELCELGYPIGDEDDTHEPVDVDIVKAKKDFIAALKELSAEDRDILKGK